MRSFFTLLLLAMIGSGLVGWDASRLLQSPLALSQTESLEVPIGSSLTT